jgi:hypothetical protein
MTTEATTPVTPAGLAKAELPKARNDFEVAGEIHNVLKDIPSDRQEKILRWVCESLGIELPTKYIERSASPRNEERQPNDSPPPANSVQPVTDIKTFIASKKPRSDTQFATAVAYYYRFVAKPEERLDTVTSDALQEASRQSRGGAFHDPLNTLNNAVKGGLLDRAAPGSFRINTVGENLVAMTLPVEGSEKPRPRAGRPRAAKKVAKPVKKR